MEENGNQEKISFWKTLPGILTGLAALVTAIAGLLAGLSASGMLGGAPVVDQTVLEEPENAQPNWSARLFNIDDEGRVRRNGREVLRCGFRKSCEVELTPELLQGRNQVQIEFWNHGLVMTESFNIDRL